MARARLHGERLFGQGLQGETKPSASRLRRCDGWYHVTRGGLQLSTGVPQSDRLLPRLLPPYSSDLRRRMIKQRCVTSGIRRLEGTHCFFVHPLMQPHARQNSLGRMHVRRVGLARDGLHSCMLRAQSLTSEGQMAHLRSRFVGRRQRTSQRESLWLDGCIVRLGSRIYDRDAPTTVSSQRARSLPPPRSAVTSSA